MDGEWGDSGSPDRNQASNTWSNPSAAFSLKWIREYKRKYIRIIKYKVLCVCMCACDRDEREKSYAGEVGPPTLTRLVWKCGKEDVSGGDSSSFEKRGKRMAEMGTSWEKTTQGGEQVFWGE